METEKRLIDANALMERLKFKRKISEKGLYRGLESAMAQCQKAPTIDAVVLPCKIGDKVYRIEKNGNYHSDYKPFIQELTVTEISWKKEKYGDKDLGFAIIADGIRYKFTSIGKSVFLTRNEAEAKMGGDGNG